MRYVTIVTRYWDAGECLRADMVRHDEAMLMRRAEEIGAVGRWALAMAAADLLIQVGATRRSEDTVYNAEKRAAIDGAVVTRTATLRDFSPLELIAIHHQIVRRSTPAK